jgi:hypothetical protein
MSLQLCSGQALSLPNRPDSLVAMDVKPLLPALLAHLASEEAEESRTKAADRLDSCFRRNDTLEHSHPLDCARDKLGCDYMCTSWKLAGRYEAGQ